MANLIIKPTSGGSLILQDEGGTAANTIDASGNSQLAGTLGVTGNATLSGTANNLGTVTAGTIDNAPAGVTTKIFGFSAYLSSGMTLNNGTWTEVTGTYTERWDTDGKFASGRFTPTIQGIYLCGWCTEMDEPDDNELLIGAIRKNGANSTGADFGAYIATRFSNTNGTAGNAGSTLMQMDTDDYISFWAYQNGGGNDPLNTDKTEFWAVYQGQV